MSLQEYAWVAMAVLLGAASACSSGDDSAGAGSAGAGGGAGGTQAPQAVDPSADTQALWTKLQGYQGWQKFPENTSPKPSGAHMNMYVVTHYNDVVASAMASKTLPLPDGSMLVKDNFASQTDAMPMAITAMSKQGGKWYWVEAMPNGKVILAPDGSPLEGHGVTMCTGCHDAAAANDDVLTHKF